MLTLTREELNAFITEAVAQVGGLDAQRVIDAVADRTKLARVRFEIDGHVCPAAAVYLAEHPAVLEREVGDTEHEPANDLLDFATAFDRVTRRADPQRTYKFEVVG